jgi:hypothetical protein
MLRTCVGAVKRKLAILLRRYHGPTMKSFESVGEAHRDALASDLLDLIARCSRTDDGTMVVPSEYLEGVIVKRVQGRGRSKGMCSLGVMSCSVGLQWSTHVDGFPISFHSGDPSASKKGLLIPLLYH